ncbi:hypothetical protein GCM10011352_13780 [Marinobacterium zhoushanense]|uniref:Uncharacterized protein n=1 Tax=Marinobacterium zhoushanense TaxID=1679163 RepID=A0ABQ1K6C7_9GAMM|nr:hypothetical protein [Marinobacterium zhoushanense]GGB89010.1 hypothetical protein GCM10011352_13780 [Marinobacterium zhoushanense]
MSRKLIFTVALSLILALAALSWQRIGEQTAKLEQNGFHISERLGGSPQLLIDGKGRRLALVGPGGYEEFPFSELHSTELGFDAHRETEDNFRIELMLRESRLRQVKFGSEWEARQALERLQRIVNAP